MEINTFLYTDNYDKSVNIVTLFDDGFINVENDTKWGHIKRHLKIAWLLFRGKTNKCENRIEFEQRIDNDIDVYIEYSKTILEDLEVYEVMVDNRKKQLNPNQLKSQIDYIS